MPRVLQHTAAEVIAQSRPHQPLPVRDVVLERPLLDCLPPDGELRAAGHADDLRDNHAGEKLLEGRLVHVLRVHGLISLGLVVVNERLNLGRAAEDPGAAQIDVALLAESVEAEALEERKRIVVWIVVVPLKTLGVVEDDVAGEGVVSLDDISMRECVSYDGILQSIGEDDAWSYVRKTMASLPLFTGTVCSALGSSTTYMLFFQSTRYSFSHVVFSFLMLATTSSTSSSLGSFPGRGAFGSRICRVLGVFGKRISP